MRKLLLLLTLSGILTTSIWASNTPTPNPIQQIEAYLAKQNTSLTAYDLAAYFSPKGNTSTAATNSTTFGAANEFNAGDVSGNYYISVAALSSTHFVVAYRDVGNSNHGTAIVGEVSGTTISSYGAENVFNSASTNYISVAALSSTHFVVVYRDFGNSNEGTAIVGEVGGTTISSYGSENVFNSATTLYISVAALSSTHFVVAYRDSGNSNHGTAIVGEVSGTTISSYGSENVFNSATTTFASVAALSSTHFVVAYRDVGNSNHGTAIVGEVSGTTISSYGSENVFNAASAYFISVAALSSTHFVVAYQDIGNSNHGTAIVGEVSGTTISTYGSEVVFNAAATNLETKGVVAMSSTKVIILYNDNGDSDKGMVIIGTISGTSISFGTEEQFATQTSHPTIARLGTNLIGPPTSNNTDYIIAYDDQTDNGHGYGRIGDASAELPVELTDFSVNTTDKGVLLTWQTASERNNEGFDIQRSIDGKNWEIIDFVQGHGTTQKIQNYTFIDKNPISGMNYYRLKQVDFDGAFEYSQIVNVNYELGVNNYELRIAPNPVQNELTIQNGKGQATIYNILGQPVRELIINNEQLTIEVSDLPKGQYILSIQRENGTVVTKSFVK